MTTPLREDILKLIQRTRKPETTGPDTAEMSTGGGSGEEEASVIETTLIATQPRTSRCGSISS